MRINVGMEAPQKSAKNREFGDSKKAEWIRRMTAERDIAD